MKMKPVDTVRVAIESPDILPGCDRIEDDGFLFPGILQPPINAPAANGQGFPVEREGERSNR
jgi:hypothetical protein